MMKNEIQAAKLTWANQKLIGKTGMIDVMDAGGKDGRTHFQLGEDAFQGGRI